MASDAELVDLSEVMCSVWNYEGGPQHVASSRFDELHGFLNAASSEFGDEAPAQVPQGSKPRRDAEEPCGTDVSWLLQNLKMKDAIIQKLEALLCLPTQPPAEGPGRPRGAEMLARSERREAQLKCKLQAMSEELVCSRKRETAAAQANRQLRQELQKVLKVGDVFALRHEARVLRRELCRVMEQVASLEGELSQARRDLDAAHQLRCASLPAGVAVASWAG